MDSKFFDRKGLEQVDSPNGQPWWHHAPLPNNRQIRGAHPDADRQFKMWEVIRSRRSDWQKKRVLDIGANDGFFSVAAASEGAHVTSINTEHWIGWPSNINYLADQWDVKLNVITGDFRETQFNGPFDVILFLGVVYHVENVFGVMKQLKAMRTLGGQIFLETHLSPLGGDTPVWEAASDIFPTSAPQAKPGVGMVGISNFLLPNVNAVVNLADTYGLKCEPLLDNDYCREDQTRGMFLIS